MNNLDNQAYKHRVANTAIQWVSRDAYLSATMRNSYHYITMQLLNTLDRLTLV